MEHERGDRKYDRNSVRPYSRRSHERQQDIPSGISIKKEPRQPPILSMFVSKNIFVRNCHRPIHWEFEREI